MGAFGGKTFKDGISKALQEICANGLSCDGSISRSISSNITNLANVRDETLFNDGIVMLQVRSGYFRTPQQKDAIINIVSSAFQNTALEANCEYTRYQVDLEQEQARPLDPGPSIKKYKSLKTCSSVTDVQFELRSVSGDQPLIATMEAILSVAAIPEPASFDCGEYLGYLEAAAGSSHPSIRNLLGLWRLVAMLLLQSLNRY
jgi:hypothetical protein